MRTRSKPALAPTALTLFAYQVGFGDCFLLRFTYPDRPRHVLIDFGTTGLPADAERDRLMRIANDIADQCGGRLDAVVATHRHADHISGFATAKGGKGPGDIIAGLKPDVVVQPWTEQPDLAVDAKGPLQGAEAGRRALAAMHTVAAATVQYLDGAPAYLAPAVAAELRFIGQDNLSNASAVNNLMTMGENHYVYHGSKSGLEKILPGVKTHVLGPPTLRQADSIRAQRRTDPDEFWHFQAARITRALSPDQTAPAFPEHVAAPGGRLPMASRWLAERIRRAKGEQLLSLVRALDKQMNNTSVILLFETAGKKLLFPGDAQIENWEFAFSRPGVLALLEDVDLYKVGHHGSLNATPKTMWRGFKKKGATTRKDRLTSVLSTRAGKHGHEEDGTEVPRSTLVKELAAHSHLHNTQQLEPGALFERIEFPL